MNNGIRIVYPRTTYVKLNEEYKKFISKKIKEFMDVAQRPMEEFIPYTLDISPDEYRYEQFISTVFYISMELGEKNSKQQIYSMVYDTKKNLFITIDSLVKKKKDILNILSEKSREELSCRDKIKDPFMLEEGTKPQKENFSVFAFTETGLFVFFSKGQVAPSLEGIFKISIRYEKLINKKDETFM